MREIRNIHERWLQTTPDEVGALVDSLASDGDRLWPRRRWPAMRLDNGLRPGSRGGHGPVRYEVARHAERRGVAFRFVPPFQVAGEHRYEVLTAPDRHGTLLRHTLEGRPERSMRLAWPLCFRWLHDALIEDSLDQAEAILAGAQWQPRPLHPWVRALRRLAARL